MKTEQRVNQRGLAGAIWTKQADRAATQFALQVLQDWAAAKLDAQVVEIYDRSKIRGIAEICLFLDLLQLPPSCRLYISVLIIPNKTEAECRAHQYECTDECKRFRRPLKFYRLPKSRSKKPEY